MRFADGFRVPFPDSTLGNRFGIHQVVDGRDVYGANGHRGQDWRVGIGARIPAIGNGTVVDTAWSEVLGNVTVLRHYLPGDDNDVYSFACHQSRILVGVGDDVALGQTYGVSGDTGSSAIGGHLHLAMSRTESGGINGEVFDPLAFIRDHPVPTTLPAAAKPKYTTAQRNEGMIAIATRSGISFRRLRQLNPPKGPYFRAPDYVVPLGTRLRIA